MSDERRAVMQAELNEFARRLREHREARGWTMTDLARAVWGDRMTERGLTVAANRERILVYEAAKSWPTPVNLTKIAAALEVTPEELGWPRAMR